MIQNNSYAKILECSLKIVEFEVAKFSTEHLILDNLVEERIENIKPPIDY